MKILMKIVKCIFLVFLLTKVAMAQHANGEDVLEGKWKLVHWDQVDAIKSSPKYLQASPEFRNAMDERIQKMMENTFYTFAPGGTLLYTMLEEGAIVQKKGSYHVDGELIEMEFSPKDTRKAKIVELTERKLVLAPSDHETKGNMIFERQDQ